MGYIVKPPGGLLECLGRLAGLEPLVMDWIGQTARDAVNGPVELFEAPGPGDLLPGEVAAAALVFAQWPPGGIKPGTDSSKSYAEWLRGAGERRP